MVPRAVPGPSSSTMASRHVLYLPAAVRFRVDGGQFDFVWWSGTAQTPHGGASIVRVNPTEFEIKKTTHTRL